MPGPPAYDYWLFDLDGTLVDTARSYRRSVFERVGRRLGHAFDPAAVDAVWHGLSGSRDATLRDLGVDPERFWTAYHEVEDPDARAAATYLHGDAAFVGELSVPVGLVTHSPPRLAAAVLDRLDVRDWFDAVVCCDADVGWKPDPAPVRRAVADLDATGAGVLAGDGPCDVGAAWNAGLDAIHVERHGPTRRDGHVCADRHCRAFTDLLVRGPPSAPRP